MGSNSRLAPNGYIIDRRDSLSGAQKPCERLQNSFLWQRWVIYPVKCLPRLPYGMKL